MFNRQWCGFAKRFSFLQFQLLCAGLVVLLAVLLTPEAIVSSSSRQQTLGQVAPTDQTAASLPTPSSAFSVYGTFRLPVSNLTNCSTPPAIYGDMTISVNLSTGVAQGTLTNFAGNAPISVSSPILGNPECVSPAVPTGAHLNLMVVTVKGAYAGTVDPAGNLAMTGTITGISELIWGSGNVANGSLMVLGYSAPITVSGSVNNVALTGQGTISVGQITISNFSVTSGNATADQASVPISGDWAGQGVVLPSFDDLTATAQGVALNGSPSPAPTTTGPTATPEKYHVFIIAVLTPGSVFVGTDSDVAKPSCDFTDGGTCSGNDPNVKVLQTLGTYDTYDQAVAAYCGMVSDIHPAFGGTKGYIGGVSYFLDNAPSCPAASQTPGS